MLRDGKVVRRVPLVTAAEVPGAGPLRVIVDELGTFLTVLLIGVILALAAAGLTRIRSTAPGTGASRPAPSPGACPGARLSHMASLLTE